MKPSSIRSFRYEDILARRRRRAFWLKGSLWSILCLALFGGAVYWLFFSEAFALRDLTLEGFRAVSQDEARQRIQRRIDDPFILNMRVQRNAFFFDRHGMRKELLAQFPALADVHISRNGLHTLKVSAAERIPLGIWCVEEACRYFDEGGFLWGDVQSSGFILPVTENERQDHQDRIGEPYITAIKQLIVELPRLGIAVAKLRVPDGALADVRVRTEGGYEIYFDARGNISEQLASLRIFLDQKNADPAFAPQYLDVRIPGRVYFK